jgi:transcriptional regulator with XRE-family HTH domain
MTKMFRKIVARLDQQGRNQEDLARAIGVRPKRISNWQAPQQPKLTAREFLGIARYLGVSLEWLVDDAKEGPPPAGVTGEEEAILKRARQLRITADGLLDMIGELMKAREKERDEVKPDAQPSPSPVLGAPPSAEIRIDGIKRGEAFPPVDTLPKSLPGAKDRKSRRSGD